MIDFALMVRLYTAGYKAGHHDTVESTYVDVTQEDAATFWEDIVDKWLEENRW